MDSDMNDSTDKKVHSDMNEDTEAEVKNDRGINQIINSAMNEDIETEVKNDTGINDIIINSALNEDIKTEVKNDTGINDNINSAMNEDVEAEVKNDTGINDIINSAMSEDIEAEVKNDIINEAGDTENEDTSDDSKSDNQMMTWMQAINLFVFGIIVPCVDIYSDIAFSFKMFRNNHPKYGIAILCPVFLSTLFILPHWWAKETLKFSLPIVFLQFWPQYRVCRLIYQGWQCWKEKDQEKQQEKTKAWKKEHLIYLKDLGSLGKKYPKISFFVLKFYYFI